MDPEGFHECRAPRRAPCRASYKQVRELAQDLAYSAQIDCCGWDGRNVLEIVRFSGSLGNATGVGVRAEKGRYQRGEALDEDSTFDLGNGEANHASI